MQVLLKDLKDMQEGTKHYTLILTDPLGKSFMQNPNHPEEDKKMKR